MCTVHESKKKKLFYSSPPIKKLLNFLSHSVPLSLSLSLSLSLLVTQLSSSLSHSPLTADRLIVPSRQPIASPSQAADRRSPHHPMPPIASPSLYSLPTQLTDLPLQPTQLADPPLLSTQLADPPFVCDWWLLILFMIIDFVWSGLRKKIGDLGFFFFFFSPAMDCWWWWCWW